LRSKPWLRLKGSLLSEMWQRYLGQKPEPPMSESEWQQCFGTRLKKKTPVVLVGVAVARPWRLASEQRYRDDLKTSKCS
jgi:hypothetical protein